MKIVKLHTITSTNSYLKDLSKNGVIENYTIVMADVQTKGRGQRENYWHSEEGKNLTFSMYIAINDFDISRQFELNQAISIGLFHAVKAYLPQVKIKWPNDILADEKKIAGILIENTISKSQIKHSIVGVGLNVNQTQFPNSLPQASSFKLLLKKDFILSNILNEIVRSIKLYISQIEKGQSLTKVYVENLYLYKKSTSFKAEGGERFIGEIVGVGKDGKLQIETSIGLRKFAFKQVIFI